MMVTLVLHVLLWTLSAVGTDIIYPGAGLVEVAWIVPNSLSQHCWLNNVVPYMFMEPDGFPYTEEQMEPITRAIDKFNEHTCLKWVHVEETPVSSMEFLVFNKTVEGWCRMKQLRNITSGVKYIILTLHVSCLEDRVEHLMMHALGFLHEHQRSDRDCYVEVHRTQVEVEKYNIVPQPHWEERYPYDKYSALHYTSNYRLRSLIVTNWKKDYRQRLGNEIGRITPMDLSKIRYKFCKGPHLCDVTPIVCQYAKLFKERKNCTIWRFTNKDQTLPPILTGNSSVFLN